MKICSGNVPSEITYIVGDSYNKFKKAINRYKLKKFVKKL